MKVFQSLLFGITLLAMTACDQTAPKAEHDYVIVPGERVGPITAKTTHLDLNAIFGAENVDTIQVYVGEGMYEPGSVVFSDDSKKQLQIIWKVGAKRELPSRIQVLGSDWQTAEGVGLGTSLAGLNHLNGKPFSQTGYGWDYGGTVLSWNGGALAHFQNDKGRILLRLDSENPQPQELPLGESAVQSDHPTLLSFAPKIATFMVEFY